MTLAEELFTHSSVLLKSVLELAKKLDMHTIDLEFVKQVAESDDLIKKSIIKDLITMHVYCNV